MKRIYSTAAALFILASASAFSQNPIVVDLHKEVSNKNIAVYNRELTLINEEGYKGIRLSQDLGEGIAWLKGIDFSNGTIEFDVRGEDIEQHSFVGIAFHGSNDSTFDAIYLRPFQFKKANEVLRSRSIQYISLPVFTWRKLRELSPNKYEHSIEPSPDPNAWIRMKVVVKGTTISTYINGSKEPSLVVETVTNLTNGAVGLYVADTSGGDFANITITKNE